MHEMALAEGVLEIVQEAARREGFRRVRALWLEIGQLSSVEPDAMRFCFQAVARGSVAADARLEIIVTPGGAWCIACARRIGLAELGTACPHCGGYRMQLTEGTELRVKQLEAE